MDTPTSGDVYIGDYKLAEMSKEELTIFRRRKVGFIFQNYNLVPDLNVFENIVLPIELDGKKIDQEFVYEILTLLKLYEKKEALPNTLSGGQQQRVAIARAIAAKPSIILADELTGNLDTATSHDVMGLLKVVSKQFQQTIILITHDNEFDAILYGLTDVQQKMCEENVDIITTGILGIAGFAIETESDSTLDIGLLWADDTYWNSMMKPARESVKGEYPQKLNEIMVTREALKECGMDELEIGDSFVLKYEDDLGIHTEEFFISGIWDGHGKKKVFYMSKAFYEQSGKELSSVASGRYFIDFKQKLMTQKAQDEFLQSLNLGKQQNLFFVSDFKQSVQILRGMAGLIFITCFCAYLLLYNIMYLSVSSNIRYYGLLQTVGMTAKQTFHLIFKQVLFVGLIGIIAGILLGSILSFVFIPNIIKIMGIRGGIQITFHLIIFILTILLTGITVCISSYKPAKKAVLISPIEATGYRPRNGKKTTRKTGKGKLLWQLSKEQLTKDKKKSLLVILSLAASLSVFLCLVTLIESQKAAVVMSNYKHMDLVVQNDTLKKENHDEWVQLLDDELLSKIRNQKG